MTLNNDIAKVRHNERLQSVIVEDINIWNDAFLETRNTKGADRLLVGAHHPSHDFFEALYEEGGSTEVPPPFRSALSRNVCGQFCL